MAKAGTGGSGRTGTTGRWRARLTRTLAAGLKDRSQLVEMLEQAHQRGVLDAEAFAMLEGVLAVADQQVRDIMIPRTQMACLRREDLIARILAAVVESGHSRFPVLDGWPRTCCACLRARARRSSTCANTCARPCSCRSPSA
jgi:Mg2+/Co2+ transporter CorC